MLCRALRYQITGAVALALVASSLQAAPVPVVDTTKSSTTSSVTREMIERLPAGRRVEDFLRTCPSGTIPTVSRQSGTSIGGQDEPLYLIDGLPVIDCVKPADIEMIEVYNVHNAARAEYGAPPLIWDPALVRSSQTVAVERARTGKPGHSSREGRGTVRENISQGLPWWSTRQLLASWEKEKKNFVPGVFPNVSRTHNWYDIGHWAQMIWIQTVLIGCSKAIGGGASWLVCHYNPGGNKDGKAVGVPPIIAHGGPPRAAPPPQQVNNRQGPRPGCIVAEPDDLLKLLADAAAKSGYAPGSPETDPRDADTNIRWDRALHQEQQVQDKIVKELAIVQGDVARHINAYLAAASTWQERYAYIASSTTGLQGLLTNWYESRAIYEKADLAFALLNLGVGLGKLGFKAYKFLTKGVAAAEGTAVAATGAGAVEAAAGGKAAAAGKTTSAALGETQVFNRTLIPPGQQPNVLGMKGYTGASSAVGQIAEASSGYAMALQGAKQKLANAKTGFEKLIAQTEIDNLMKMGPTGYEAQQAARAAAAFAELDAGIVKLAREAGVNVEATVAKGANVAEKEWELLKAIAKARGWHDIPAWANTPITNTLLQARKILGGVQDAKISPKDLELIKSLKTYVESQGLNFAQYLRTAAGEVAGGIVAGESKPITEIIKYYDEADINLLLKVLDTGGDAAQLRNAVSPVAQASLNGLANAGSAIPGALQAGQGACGVLDSGAKLTGAGGGQGATAPGGKPTDAQLQNVMTGLGELGQVGLGNVVDQFGVTDRFAEGQGYGRAVVGELWEFITSPSATTASFYYTLEAQNLLLDLLRNEQKSLVELGTSLDAASSALGQLQNTLQRAGLSGPDSYLGTRGPVELRRTLDELQRIYDSGSDGWKQRHKDEMDERRRHITEKLQDLSETVADLNALAAKMGLVRNWLDSLRLGPDGKPRGPVELFNPAVFVRLGSIGLYLRGMGADAFGLTSDVPFRVTVPNAQAQPRALPLNRPQPQPASAPAEDFDAYMKRMRERSAILDAQAETEVDPDFDKWIESLDKGE